MREKLIDFFMDELNMYAPQADAFVSKLMQEFDISEKPEQLGSFVKRLTISLKPETIKYGKNHFHLIIRGYIPELNNSKLYYFDYLGTEIVDDNDVSEVINNKICEKLNECLGFSGQNGFDLEKSKQALLGNSHFSIIY